MTNEESKEIVRKAVANPRSGLKENKDAWLYFNAHIDARPDEVPLNLGGTIHPEYANLFDGKGNLI